MKEWSKSFFGSFFRNKIAADVTRRSFWQSILSFVLAIVVLFLTSVAGVFASFPIHFKRSASFRSFVYGVFGGVELQIRGGLAASIVSGDGGTVINTYQNDGDKSAYSVNGYNLIIDTRPVSDTFNDFSVLCERTSDKSAIAYDEYKLLPSADKSGYKLSIVYGENELVLTEEKIEDYCGYLSLYATGETLQKYNALCRDGVSSSEYPELYRLYFNTYYPDFADYDEFGVAPTMRSSYINKYLSADESGNAYSNYLILLQDVVFASWRADNGTLQTLSGFYSKKDITLSNPSQAEVDGFFTEIFNANANIVVINYLINYLFASMALTAAWLLLSLILSAVGWISKKALLRSYGGSLKTVGSFSLFSALIAAAASFVCGFFLSKTQCFIISLSVFCATLLVRSILFAVYAFVDGKDEPSVEQDG